MKSGNSFAGSAMVAGGFTFLGAGMRTFGGGSANQIRNFPRAPSLYGPLPNSSSLFPRSMPFAINSCTVAAVTFK
jgi:hypothetical protein